MEHRRRRTWLWALAGLAGVAALLLVLFRGNVLVYYQLTLGRADQGSGELEQALRRFDAAVRQQPLVSRNTWRSLAHGFRGQVRHDLADYTGAIEDLTLATSLDATRTDFQGLLVVAYHNRGNARFERQDWDGAIRDYERAIDLSPGYTVPVTNLATAHARRGARRLGEGRFEEALRDFATAITLDVERIAFRRLRARAFVRLGRPDDALAEYALVAQSPERAWSDYAERAAIYRDQGRLELARRDYEEALRLARALALTEREAALTVVGAALLELGRVSEDRERGS